MEFKSFSEYLTEAKGEVYFVFGRFNPPTSGHEKLFDKLKKTAGSNPYPGTLVTMISGIPFLYNTPSIKSCGNGPAKVFNVAVKVPTFLSYSLSYLAA